MPKKREENLSLCRFSPQAGLGAPEWALSCVGTATGGSQSLLPGLQCPR